MFQGVASSETGELVEKPRIHSSFNFVHGHVCAACNGGWMRHLEDAAKPILVTLMDGQRTIDSLTKEQTALVSKWAVKTAYLHTWAGPLKDPVQITHLRPLYGDAGHWPQFTRHEKPNGVTTPPEACKIAVQYKRLYLLVAFWPALNSALVRLMGMHIRIWAPGAPDEEWQYPTPDLAGPLGPCPGGGTPPGQPPRRRRSDQNDFDNVSCTLRYFRSLRETSCEPSMCSDTPRAKTACRPAARRA